MKKIFEDLKLVCDSLVDKILIVCAFGKAKALNDALEEHLSQFPEGERRTIQRLMEGTSQSFFAQSSSLSEPSALPEIAADMTPPKANDKRKDSEPPKRRGRPRKGPKFPPDPSAN